MSVKYLDNKIIQSSDIFNNSIFQLTLPPNISPLKKKVDANSENERELYFLLSKRSLVSGFHTLKNNAYEMLPTPIFHAALHQARPYVSQETRSRAKAIFSSHMLTPPS